MPTHDDELALVRPKSPAARERPDDRAAPGLAPDHARVLRLQRAAGNAGVGALLAGEEERSPVLDVVGQGRGQPLDPATRTTMESRLGQNFADVRVHTDAAAAASATSVQASAYTVGNDVVFGAGQYDSASPATQRTLAHELTHVVQQRTGAVDGTPAAGGIQVSNPSDRFEQEAERAADRAMAAPAASVEAHSHAAVQREEAPASEEVPEEVPVAGEEAS